MEKGSPEREFCSRLLKHCSANLNFKTTAFTYAFDDLLFYADLLQPDFPYFKEYIVKFLCRAVIDKALPSSYIINPQLINIKSSLALEIIHDSLVFLKVKLTKYATQDYFRMIALKKLGSRSGMWLFRMWNSKPNLIQSLMSF